ncbi:iron complex outermembrane receptor protein [Mucilaginibacter frigoritolerans]|uniref:Iron complex outermembrane receptor protein n=1 Tax=Mucilaginibacter frigoritolerans TaxID=652788 RepID=A0A562UAI2_9SPHI|nr:TonB-dependent receptor [Mucilaginibacter frigoritolerans]TWJ02427.1 iron complex outermembrane receptor protein [Mucilaginibacter frigoritolerans]
MKILYIISIRLTFLMIICCNIVKADDLASGKISGTVKTSDGQPAAFVTVSVKELNRATSTEADGTYIISSIKPGNYTVVVSFVGTQSQEKRVTVTKSTTTIADFTLTESSSKLNEVIINANRAPKPVSLDKANIRPLDLPQSTGTVSSQVIEDQQINRLGDAVKNVSGVSLTQTRGGVGETFSARGYSIGITGASSSIFKDGVLTNTAGFPEASTLESVEVLKGSAALLYGNVSGGLIINMVTKKPQFESGGEVSMRYGSYDMFKPSVDVYGPISENVAFRLIGVYENDGSYRNHVYTIRKYVNPSLLFNLDKKTTLLVEGDYLRESLTPDFGIGSLNNGRAIPTMVPRSQYINTSWAYSHMNQFSGMATLNHQFNDNWHLNAIISGQGTDIDSYQASLPNTVSATGDWNRGLARANTIENDYTGQVNLTGKFKTGSLSHQLLIGTDVTKVVNVTNGYSVAGQNISTYIYDKINTIDLNKYTQRTDIPNATDTSRTTAPVYRLGTYAQDLVSFTDKIKMLAGIRWSWQETDQTNIQYLLKQTSGVGTALTRYDRAFSPKLAFIYQPISTSSVYASYSNNFLVNTGTDVNTGQALKPSLVNQYEVGSKNELFDGKIIANVSVYRIINSNLAVVAPFKADGTVNSDNTVKELSGQTTSDGFDIDITGHISKNFYFITGYSYNNARYTKTSGLKGSPILGERLVISPVSTANATLFYTFTDPALKGFKVGATAFYTGSRMAGYNNTVGQTQAYSRLVPVSGFTTLDLSAGYTYKKISLLASITNVTNTLNYLIHDNYSITPIAPRQFLTTLSYKF